MSDEQPDLPARMQLYADSVPLPADHPLRKLQADLLAALANPETTLPQLLVAWARARKEYCRLTGEPLI